MDSPSLYTNKAEQGGSVEEKPIPLNENVMQKHAAFFDLNHDGLIYPWETFKGLRAIGSGILLSTGLTLFINLGLSQSTRPGKFPSLLFPIEVKNIQLAKHGSDTGVYDTEGRFVPSKFEEIFTKHAHKHPNALTYDELKEMIKANREPKDFKGRIGSLVEWNVLYKLAKDKDGLLQKETIRGVYDGSLFELLKKERTLMDQPPPPPPPRDVYDFAVSSYVPSTGAVTVASTISGVTSFFLLELMAHYPPPWDIPPPASSDSPGTLEHVGDSSSDDSPCPYYTTDDSDGRTTTITSRHLT